MEQPQKKYNNVVPQTCWQKLFKKNIDYNQLLDRSIISNIPDPQIPSNRVETSKYNYFTFLPLNLIEQFTKVANVYFLFIGILQMIPAITLSQGRPTIFIPLFLVVVVSMIKDFIEDYKRRKSDERQNQSQIQVLTPIGFARRHWEDIQVGHIIRVKKDQYFPCDIILLDYNKQQKTAFIQTKNLDGETNLKLRKICQHIHHLRGLPELDLNAIRLQFAYEKPNPFLSTFNGNVKNNEKKYMIENSNLILRGCSLKINEWAIGLCVYTGHQTKILLNSGSHQRKVSKLEKHLNSYFKRIFIFQIVATFISALCYGISYTIHSSNQGYIGYDQNIVVATLTTWGSWFVSFSSFIPISLYVTVQIVRFFQGKILGKDELCSSRGLFTEAQSSNLNEELGQIEYVMTDKTGTLTQNLMQFKELYINGYFYGSIEYQPKSTEIISDVTARQIMPSKEEVDRNSEVNQNILIKKIANVDFPDSERLRIIQNITSGSQQGHKIRQALIHLSLCHNVLAQKGEYSSSSPDELALVSFAKYIGFEYIEKNDENEMIVKEELISNQVTMLKYKLLHVLEFSSERKRMSVIVKDLNREDEPVLLLTKGADEIIIPRTEIFRKNKQKGDLSKVQQALSKYACQGLRTLLLAQKQLDSFLYTQWSNKYDEALTVIGPERYDIIQKLQSNLQKDLHIVGATAIEDKLQPKVKETIENLKKSNIKVWMLTGDKKETAISIGYSCGILDGESQKITLDCSAEHAKSLLNNLDSMIHLLTHKKVTIVSGQFIRKIDDQSRIILENILFDSESVICCRVSPKDKEYVTQMVKRKGITLAVGDGANDVNMIHEANVGVGVRGIEGSQATRAADYTITEFRLLHRLIVYHGLNFYHRNCNVMLYTLYKNMIITFPGLFYGPISLESATFLYEIWIFQFYNIFFVSFPIVYYGVFDILFSSIQTKIKPELYKQGQNNAYFNNSILVKLVLQTSLIAVFLVYTVFYSSELMICEKGLMIYYQWSGNLIMAIVVVCCNIRIILMSHQLNIMQGFLCSIGPLLYFLIFFLIDEVVDTDVQNTLSHQMSTFLYWNLMIFCCFVVEGATVVENTIIGLQKAINQKLKLKQLRRQRMKTKLGEIEMMKVEPKQFEVVDDMIKEKKENGGYAFAEDENRNEIEAAISYGKKQKQEIL